MPQSAPSFTDYVPILVKAMRHRGLPEAAIDVYLRRLAALPDNCGEPPCPFCLGGEKTGRLVTLPAQNHEQCVCCSECHEEILIRKIA